MPKRKTKTIKTTKTGGDGAPMADLFKPEPTTTTNTLTNSITQPSRTASDWDSKAADDSIHRPLVIPAHEENK
jgi:hypothetical protein